MESVTAPTVAEGIRQLLDLAALSASEGIETDRARVNLLTLHATKGLEFSRVYVVGVEDYQLPGYQAVTRRLDDEFPEARRLLYVGMTRARDRLTLTRAEQRAKKPSGGSRFLDELGVVVERAQASAVAVPA
jgi:DNA helicase-2/ATP-dependent DNA helicase PcrA